MPADEKRWWVGKDQWFNAFVVVAGVAANVGDPHFHLFNGKFKVLFEHLAHFLIVDVTINAPQRFEVGQMIERFDVAKIAGVPNLVAPCKKLINFWVDKPVSIR